MVFSGKHLYACLCGIIDTLTLQGLETALIFTLSLMLHFQIHPSVIKIWPTHDKAMHQCVSCDLCSLYTVIYVLIAVSDAYAYAFAISVATIGKYARSRSVQVHKEIHKSAGFNYKTLLQYIKMNLIACTYVQ